MPPTNTPTLVCTGAESALTLFGNLISTAPIWFDNVAGIISVNTQARRLGCLTYFVSKIAGGRRVESMLLAPAASDIHALNENLRMVGHTSGQLTENKSSVKHYLDAAVHLRLLAKQGALFTLTNRGQFLADIIRLPATTPYPLSDAAKTFFFDTLLRTDFFGVVAVLRLLSNSAQSLTEMQELYSRELLTVLERVGRSHVDARLRRLAQDRMITIRNWRKPESYAEHLVPAKLNWLLDLEIVEPCSLHKYSVTAKFKKIVDSCIAILVPTEADVAWAVWAYATEINDDAPAEQDACAMLEAAFNHIAKGTRLVKARCADLILYLLCFHGHALRGLASKQMPLFPLPMVVCGDRVFRFTIASRSTQSFVVCTKKGTL